jgi:hypothetical protein
LEDEETKPRMSGQLLENDENLVFETSSDVKILPSFDAMGLKEDLLRGVYAYSRGSSPCASGPSHTLNDRL